MYLIVVKEPMPEKQLKSFRQFLHSKNIDAVVLNADVDIYELHEGVKEPVPVMSPMAQVTSAPVKWAASAHAHGVVGGLYDLGKSAYGAAEAVGGMAVIYDHGGELVDDGIAVSFVDAENPRAYPTDAHGAHVGWECGVCRSPECMVSPAGVFTCAACGWTSGQSWPAKAVAVPLSATPFAFDAVYKPTLEDIKAATANAIETYGLPALIVSLAETTGPFPLLTITLAHAYVADAAVIPGGFSMTELQAWGAVEATVQSLMPAGVTLILKEADS